MSKGRGAPNRLRLTKANCSTVRLLILCNAAFWMIFAVYFAANSYAYTPHTKAFEEVSPPYIICSRAFPFDQYASPFMRVSRLLQSPSFYAAGPINSYASSRGIVVDQMYGSISVGGYSLICACLISFVQWFFVGALIDGLRQHSSRRDGTAGGA